MAVALQGVAVLRLVVAVLKRRQLVVAVQGAVQGPVVAVLGLAVALAVVLLRLVVVVAMAVVGH